MMRQDAHYSPQLEGGSKLTLRIDREWRRLLEGASVESEVPEAHGATFFFRPREGLGARSGELPNGLIRQAGDQLGGYEFDRLVGMGGMGQVWQARDVRLGTVVALKLMRPDRASSAHVDMLLREGRASGRVKHPGIISVLGAGQDGDVCWLVQEYVEGECTLADFLLSASPDQLPPDYDARVALFFFQLADALVAAHRAGVHHRDIKPANIMIGAGDRPKIADFGLAKVRGEESIGGLGCLEGTPGYMSPEQALGKLLGIDHRTDIFGLGACLHHAIALAPPFGDGGIDTILRRTLEASPSNVNAMRPHVLPDLAAVCAKALAKDPSERYQDMRAMRDDLANVLDGREVSVRPIGRGARWLRRARRNPRTAVGIGAATVVACLVALLIASWLGSRGSHIETQYALHLERASRATELGQLEEAMRQFVAAETLRPNHPEAMLLQASWHARRGHYNEAEACLDRAIESGFDPTRTVDESDTQSSIEQAKIHARRGLYFMARNRLPAFELAKRELEASLELDPNNRSAAVSLLHVTKAMNDEPGALRALDLIERGLSVGDSYRLLVDVWREDVRGHEDRALAALELAWDELSTHPGARLEIDRDAGRYLLNLGRSAEAVDALEIALDVDPYDDDSRTNLGIACVRLAENLNPSALGTTESAKRQAAELAARAVEYGRDACEERPWSIEAAKVVLHGECLHLLAAGVDTRGEHHELRETLPAILEFREAFPDDPLATELEASLHFHFGTSAFHGGRDQSAQWHFSRCVDLDATAFRASVLAGETTLYLDPVNHERALEYFEHALSLLDSCYCTVIETAPDKQIDEGEVRWLKICLIHRLALATSLQREDLAADSRAKIDAVLAKDSFKEDANLLNYAEALVRSPFERVASAHRASELMEDYLGRVGRQPDAWNASYRPTIEGIMARLQGNSAEEDPTGGLSD